MDPADEKRPPETPGDAKPPKRKMKSPYQLEVLEKTYAVETYPSEALRAELSAKIGLTDRQLQMWFCHRRLKDRKGPPSAGKQRQREEDDDDDPPSLPPQMPPPPPPPPQPQQQLALVAAPGAYEPRKASGRVAVPRITGEAAGKRYYEAPPPQMLVAHPPPAPQMSVAELRVIASVEAQLGEPLREDGPILGVMFDPLPPGAFGAPIETDTPALSTHVHAKARQSLDRLECTALPGQQKQSVRSYDSKIFERHEAKSIKASALLPTVDHSLIQSSSSGRRKPSGGGALVVHSQAASRAVHEYQFLPEQPSIRAEPYERPSNPHFYDSSMVAPTSRLPPLPPGAQVLHGNEQVAPSYTFQGQISSAGLLSQHGRHQIVSSASAEYEGAPHNNSNTNAANDAQFGIHQVTGSENPFMASERRISCEEDTSRIERKRKHTQSDEARIAKEVEAHEKRIRRELEKQDILRRKREEQMRKEMERHDRERKKEEERMLRERQREEERFHREQRRELERREKFLQKETRRAEKLRQKEELRRAKEAARLKAANERATARRIAKESMELIEDERLELMELAVSSKGLSSIISLDSDTLQQLDLFREMLSTFPTKAVRLKRPFQIQPWTNSEENIGNLLMVWKFLITFADVFGLWPFTLDEFVQSLHDYDSRLLGEVHVAILKSIIKDIEDVARTPAVALGVNQNSAANPGGGHPQIVEGAYTWGFDIRCWQLHLNPLTWPEILRQFALSAGFGPQLKKRTVEHTYFRDDNEGNDGDDVISILRNGAAAENAVALMQVRGYPHRRRSRHRLTPGTVKFAAFHVLSLEGSNGLTILEVADKIQKSGLRDLTTSKTPEASIAAALSRDTKLFERTAPSTYSVRSPYRKDPANADTVLSAAREKIQVFASGLSDSEEIEKDVEDADDAERDEDSDCDVADDTEVDDTTTETKLTKHVPQANAASLENRRGEAFSDKARPTPPNGLMNVEKGFSTPLSGNSKGMSISSALQSLDMCSNNHEADVDETEIDESNLGEPWIQGLTEGEYSDLSVEERLNALVALIGVAIEGNSIRVILEERLEAATALKKQMWAEAQLDKRRLKEDYVGKMQHSTFSGYKGETTQLNPSAEGNQTSLHIVDNKGDDENTRTVNNDQFLDPHCQGNIENTTCAERTFLGQDCSANPDAVPLQQHGYAAEKSRSQLKSYIGYRAEELYVYRSLPLGQDRRRNRYWMFSTSSSRNDPGSGRIFFESRDGFWRLIDSEEAFDSLVAALDTRGVRESHLHSMLQRIEMTFKETIRRQLSNSLDTAGGLINTGATTMSSSSERSTKLDSLSSLSCGLTTDTLEYSSSFKIELGLNDVEREAALKRYNCFMRWMWKECHNPFILRAMKYGKKRCSEMLQICQLCYHSYFAEERHCPSCHKTFKSFHYTDIHFNEHVGQCEEKRKTDPDWKIQPLDSTVPVGVRLVKAQLSLIEASIPADALQSFWTEGYRKSWGVKLQSSSSAEDLLQILSLLEGAIKRDHLSSNFETTSELLASASGSSAGNTIIGAVQVLPWVPDTTAALALRLLDLDASISYIMDEAEKEKEMGGFVKLPSRYPVVKGIQEPEPADTPNQVDYRYEQRWQDPGSGRRGRGRVGRGRGGRGRGRGGRGTRGLVISTRTEYMEGTLNYEKTTRKYTRRGRARGRGRGRGRRIVRPCQMPELSSTFEKVAHFGNFNDMGSSARQDSAESSPRSSGGEEWHLEEEMRMPYIEEDDNSAGSHSDENGQASGEEYDDQMEDYGRGYVSKPTGAIGNESEEEDDSIGDEVEDDRDRERHEFLDADVDDDYEEIGDDGMDIEEGEGNGDEDGTSSFSSDYSD